MALGKPQVKVPCKLIPDLGHLNFLKTSIYAAIQTSIQSVQQSFNLRGAGGLFIDNNSSKFFVYLRFHIDLYYANTKSIEIGQRFSSLNEIMFTFCLMLIARDE